jgi:hypothetical protein
MALIDAWIQRRLANYADISTTAETTVRVFPVFAPEDAPEPYITFLKASVERDYNTRKNDGIPKSTFEINCWDTDYKRLKNFADIVRYAIDGYTEDTADFKVRRAFVTNEQDIPDPSDFGFEQPTYGVQFTLEVAHTEAVATYT